jgi:hypothetical protein
MRVKPPRPDQRAATGFGPKPTTDGIDISMRTGVPGQPIIFQIR